MADALDLKSSEGNLVRVQVSLPALRQRGMRVSALLAHGKTCGTWKRLQVTLERQLLERANDSSNQQYVRFQRPNLAYMKVGDAYMEKQKCLEIAIKNLSKYEGYKLLALCGNEEDSIKIIDSEGIEHLYKFHFIISDGNEVVDDMHYKKPIKASEFFNNCINKDAVFDRRVSELNADIVQKLCVSVGALRIAHMI